MKKTTHNRLGRKLVERDIEAYGKKKCAELGWVAEKFVSPQKRAVPDNIVSAPRNVHHPHGFVFFIEYKKPGGKPTPLQLADHKKRREAGFIVFVCDCYEAVDAALLEARRAYANVGT